MYPQRLLVGLLGLAPSATAGCEAPEKSTQPTLVSPVPTSPTSGCDSTALASPNQQVSRLFPISLGRFCADPNRPLILLDEPDAESFRDRCGQLLGERCPRLLDEGAFRVAVVRYVDKQHGNDTVSATLIGFGSNDGAYTTFSDLLHGALHPADTSGTDLNIAGQSILRAPEALLVHGATVLEAEYDSSRLTREQVADGAPELLKELLQTVSERLGGEFEAPLSVRLLPDAERIPFGTRYERRDVLGVEGAGGGAIGYYRRNEQRYLVYVNEALDEGAARDIERTFRKQSGYRRLEKMTFSAFELDLMLGGGKSTWLIARLDSRVVGVGDDLYGVTQASKEARERQSLSRLDKFRLLRDALIRKAPPSSAPSTSIVPPLPR